MNTNPGRNGHPGGPDRDLENLLALGVGILIATAVLPALMSKLITGLDQWLLEHHVLVPAKEALFALPGMSAGPDLRRVLILALALVAVACMLPSRSSNEAKG